MSFVACVSVQLDIILSLVYSIVLIAVRETLSRIPTKLEPPEFKRNVFRLELVPASPKIN